MNEPVVLNPKAPVLQKGARAWCTHDTTFSGGNALPEWVTILDVCEGDEYASGLGYLVLRENIARWLDGSFFWSEEQFEGIQAAVSASPET